MADISVILEGFELERKNRENEIVEIRAIAEQSEAANVSLLNRIDQLVEENKALEDEGHRQRFLNGQLEGELKDNEITKSLERRIQDFENLMREKTDESTEKLIQTEESELKNLKDTDTNDEFEIYHLKRILKEKYSAVGKYEYTAELLHLANLEINRLLGHVDALHSSKREDNLHNYQEEKQQEEFESLKSSCRQLRNSHRETNARLIQMSRSNVELTNRIATMTSQLRLDRSVVDNVLIDNDRLSIDNSDCRENLRRMEGELVARDVQIKELLSKCRELDEICEKYEKENNDVMKKIENLKAKLADREKEVEEQEAKSNSLKQDVKLMTNNIQLLQDELDQTKSQIVRLKKLEKKNISEVETLKSQLQKLKDGFKNNEKLLQEKDEKIIGHLLNEISKSDSKHEYISENVLRKLLQLKKEVDKINRRNQIKYDIGKNVIIDEYKDFEEKTDEAEGSGSDTGERNNSKSIRNHTYSSEVDILRNENTNLYKEITSLSIELSDTRKHNDDLELFWRKKCEDVRNSLQIEIENINYELFQLQQSNAALTEQLQISEERSKRKETQILEFKKQIDLFQSISRTKKETVETNDDAILRSSISDESKLETKQRNRSEEIQGILSRSELRAQSILGSEFLNTDISKPKS